VALLLVLGITPITAAGAVAVYRLRWLRKVKVTSCRAWLCANDAQTTDVRCQPFTAVGRASSSWCWSPSQVGARNVVALFWASDCGAGTSSSGAATPVATEETPYVAV
jgi:hypothetical protein